MKSARHSARSVDPALAPFLDALAELLAAREQRLAESRRVLQAATKRAVPQLRAIKKGHS